MPDRYVEQPREPILRDTGAIVTDSFNNRTTSEYRQPIVRGEGRSFSDLPVQNQATVVDTDLNARILNTASRSIQVLWNPFWRQDHPTEVNSNQEAVVSPAQPGSFYGNGDPNLVLADIFRNIFGNSGDASQPLQTGQALVPVTSTSSGTGGFVLIAVLIAVGIAGYYLYKKYKG